jgi:hypothetical protein
MKRSSPVPPEAESFYRKALQTLREHELPFVLGGAYALREHTGVVRRTKDLDIFIRATDLERALAALSAAGLRTQSFAHWLGKAFSGKDSLDIIFRSANGHAKVDDIWFQRAVEREVLGVPVSVCPPEEMIWSKGFIMERERFDGADVAHLIYKCADQLDWDHLIGRYGSHWRVLLAHLILFGFIYPSERHLIPRRVTAALIARLDQDEASPGKVCHGTLLSRSQYLIDLEEWGFSDARLLPHGNMTEDEVGEWTRAAQEEHP